MGRIRNNVFTGDKKRRGKGTVIIEIRNDCATRNLKSDTNIQKDKFTVRRGVQGWL